MTGRYGTDRVDNIAASPGCRPHPGQAISFATVAQRRGRDELRVDNGSQRCGEVVGDTGRITVPPCGRQHRQGGEIAIAAEQVHYTLLAESHPAACSKNGFGWICDPASTMGCTDMTSNNAGASNPVNS